MKRLFWVIPTSLLLIFLLAGCEKEKPINELPEKQKPTNPLSDEEKYVGMYILNQGAYGSPSSTLDYLEFATGTYTSNIYEGKNPDAQLGGTGNDLQVYGSRLYAVMNGTGKVVVMNARTAEKLGELEVANCRHIAFRGGYAYVSTYAGADYGSNPTALGQVVSFDTATIQEVARVDVGCQPEGLTIAGDTLYVANSGGYTAEKGKTISVVALGEQGKMKEEYQIELSGVNPQYLRSDSKGQMWVTTQGNFGDIAANLHRLTRNPEKGNRYEESFALNSPCTNFTFKGSNLCYHHAPFDGSDPSFGVINIEAGDKVSGDLFTLADGKSVQLPFCISVHSETGWLFIGDAISYAASNGTLFWFNADGTLKGSYTTGAMPAAVAFMPI